MKHPFIDLTDPLLGSQLFEHPRGKLPILAWEMYCWRHSGGLPPVSEWLHCPDPDSSPIEPKRALDEGRKLVHKIIDSLLRGSKKEALDAASETWHVLARGSSWRKPKRGQPNTMRAIAVRAYIIRRYNPHPENPGESTVKWRDLADKLFLKDGKCPRKIRDKLGTSICGVARHQSDDPCVKALRTAVVQHLRAAMEHDGIPY